MIRASFAATLLLLVSVAAADDLLSAGQPDEAQIQQYAAAGYQTIIDLRTAGEDRGLDEEAAVTAAGMEYISFPVAGRAAINFENAEKLDALLDTVDGPVVLHCGSGNRVGALLALRASLNGASDKEALATGEQSGLTGLRPVVQKLLAEDD